MTNASDSSLISHKRLILRLSSLGDVILCTSSLETASSRSGVDWVVAKEYADVLRGHPRIRKLWEFDRRQYKGLMAWKRFARELWREGYTEVIDLHGSIRTRYLRVLFFAWSVLEGAHGPRWTVASKQRFRSWGYILFKKLWPKFWMSRLQPEIFAKAAGGTGAERPNLRHLIHDLQTTAGGEFSPKLQSFKEALAGRPYICIMPGSTWPAKTWAAEKYVELLRELGAFPVIMGTLRDPESFALARLLKETGELHYSGVGEWSLRESAQVLAGSQGYIGSDTGLALLAESLGVRVLVIYGPTAPGLGFEPYGADSRTAGSELWCRPCGKIGHRCYRIKNKHLCLKDYPAAAVIPIAREMLLRAGENIQRRPTGQESGSGNQIYRLYLWGWKTIAEKWLLPKNMGQERLRAVEKAVTYFSNLPIRNHAAPGKAKVSRFWLHAASAGELESLWPVAEELARRGNCEYILTGFSHSAEKPITRLAASLEKLGAKVIYSGFSPWEGYWQKALDSAKPDIFITAKYEAWPDLWFSLAQTRVPIAIVGARARKSLRIGKRLCESFGGSVPRLLLLAVLEEECEALRRDFPSAIIERVGEPRWDRVKARAEAGNERARKLLLQFRDAPRPWGIFGSVWPKDLEVCAGRLPQISGTLWMVPHRTDSEMTQVLENQLRILGFGVLRTSAFSSASAGFSDGAVTTDFQKNKTCILVDEIGFLSELYSAADWAYVGGGFGDGVHSTIEPAIHGIPIASGHVRASRFSEIQQLTRTGQLRIIHDSGEFESWMDWRESLTSELRRKWEMEVKSCFGAGVRAAEAILNF